MYLENNNISKLELIDDNFYLSRSYKDAKNSLNLFIENIKSVYDKYGYEKYTTKFVDYYSLEIAEYLKLLKQNEGLDFISEFDYKNKHIYKEIND